MCKSRVGVPVDDNTSNSRVDGESEIGEDTGTNISLY